MVTMQRAREERGRGVPLDDAQRIARHYGISIDEACDLLTIYSVSDLLPERGYGLPSNFEMSGHSLAELRYGLDRLDTLEGGKLDVAIVSKILPEDEEVGSFYVRATAAGFDLTYPELDVIDGFPVMSFTVSRDPSIPGTTGFAWAALIPLIPTALIAGLIAFGITKIADISKALVPLLLISLGGFIVIAAILTRRPVVEAAGRFAERRFAKTELKYLPATRLLAERKTEAEREARHQERYGEPAPPRGTGLAREYLFPEEITPPELPEKIGPEHLPYLAEVDPRKFCCRLCGECAPPELLAEGKFPERIAWLRHHYKEKHPGMWGHVPSTTSAYNDKGGDLHVIKGLETSMAEEKEAAAVYRARGTFAEETGDPKTAELYRHVAGEEDHHYQEFKERKDQRKLEFLGDSAEFLAQTVDMTGWRQKLDQTFETAIARARS